MDITPLLETVTPLGIVVIMLVLGYYVFTKMLDKMADHYQRQTELLNQLNITMMSCAERLEDIEESFKDLSRK